MEGVDRLNELKDEFLIDNIMSRLDCTTKELIKTTATISKRWKTLWTQLPHLIFSNEDDGIKDVRIKTDLHAYISFIDNTLNKCPTDLNLKTFKLKIDYSSLVNTECKSRANTWIRHAISRNAEEVDLELFDMGGGSFGYDDELFFNNLCFNRVKLTTCWLNPPNGEISWKRLKCLCLSKVILDEEDMIEKILFGSPCLESLELNDCRGYRRIDIISKSVKKLVFSGYTCNEIDPNKEGYIDCVKIYAPYISSLTIKGMLDLWELVLLDMSSLVEAHIDYSLWWSESEIFEQELRGLLESLDHVKDITYGGKCFELLSRLKAGSDMSHDA